MWKGFFWVNFRFLVGNTEIICLLNNWNQKTHYKIFLKSFYSKLYHTFITTFIISYYQFKDHVKDFFNQYNLTTMKKRLNLD